MISAMPLHGRRHPLLKFLALAATYRAFSPHHGRGPFGPPWGKRGTWGPGKPKGRRFGRGDLKYVILDLLKDGPRHGYDIIRALEERFHGFYSPSPGSVYPTLQLLEDQDLVRSAERDGKRVYTITDAGREFLKENAETVEDVHGRAAFRGMRSELRDLIGEFRRTAEALFDYARSGALDDPDKLKRLREVIIQARTDIESILGSNEPAARPEQ